MWDRASFMASVQASIWKGSSYFLSGTIGLMFILYSLVDSLLLSLFRMTHCHLFYLFFSSVYTISSMKKKK